ncbi:MAG: transposase [Chloroflexi bacterium]|nr:MAG: transposase [Chloroflexota bacterium]
MQKVQKTYTPELKHEAVHLAQTCGKPITHVAHELGISDTSIHQWRKELAEHGPEAFPESRAHDYLMTTMCRVLEVSVSGYYAWCHRTPSQQPKRCPTSLRK